MRKATPVEMRKALEAVEKLKEAGLLFVPIPVLSDEDYLVQIGELFRRIDQLDAESEAT
jgi:hypothetical protein